MSLTNEKEKKTTLNILRIKELIEVNKNTNIFQILEINDKYCKMIRLEKI